MLPKVGLLRSFSFFCVLYYLPVAVILNFFCSGVLSIPSQARPIADLSSSRLPRQDLNSLNLTSWHSRIVRVPNTFTVLKITALSPHVPIDPIELRSLLRLAQGTVNEGIERHGGDTQYPADQFGERTLHEIGWHVELEIQSLPQGLIFTYQHLADVFKGLMIFTQEGRRNNYAATFLFWNNIARYPELGPPRGKGFIRVREDDIIEAATA